MPVAGAAAASRSASFWVMAIQRYHDLFFEYRSACNRQQQQAASPYQYPERSDGHIAGSVAAQMACQLSCIASLRAKARVVFSMERRASSGIIALVIFTNLIKPDLHFLF